MYRYQPVTMQLPKTSTIKSSKTKIGFQSNKSSKEEKNGEENSSEEEMNIVVIEIERCSQCPWIREKGNQYSCVLSVPDVEHRPVILMKDNATEEKPEWCLLNRVSFAIKSRDYQEEQN